MKKTLFLSAILGAALCGTAFSAEYEVNVNSATEIMFNDGSANQHLSASQAGDIITLNVTQPAGNNGGYFQDVAAGGTATIAADLVINSLVFNNGYSRNPGITYKFTGDVSGSGAFTRNANQFGNTFLFTGDLSNYTGAITFYSKAASSPVNALVFDASGRNEGMTVGAASITMNSGTKLGTNGNVSFAGTITSSNTEIGSGVVSLAANATLSGTTALADGASLQVGEGATATLSGTVNAQTTNGTSSARDKSLGNGFGTADYSTVIGTGNLNTDGVTTWTLNGSAATYTADTHTLSYQGESTEYWFYTTGDLSDAAGATKITLAAEDAETTLDMGNTDHGAMDLDISKGKVTVSGNNNGTGFITGKVTVGAGSTLELTGHDALGYNNGDGKGSATSAIVMQGTEGNKAVLDNQDTSGGNAASLTFTTDLTLNGHTEVKGNTIKVFGMKVTATGTDNTIANNLTLDKNLTVEVTGASDKLDISGNISGSNTLTQTGAGTMTIKGSTIGNNVTLNNTGSGSTVLDSVVLGGRVNLYNTGDTIMTGGATCTANNSYALVVSNGSTANVTMKEGTYNLGNNHVGIAAAGTLTVAKDAALTAQNIYNSSSYLTSNGTLNIQGDAQDKGSVTANGATYLTTLNNAGTATFNGAYNGTTVNLTGDSTTTFNGATSIGTLTIADTATLAGTGAVTITEGITAVTPVDVTINNLTLNAGTTVQLGEDHTGELTTSALTINSNANSELHINADLVIANGGTVTFNGGTVTLGCSVTFGEGSTVALGTAYLEELEANGKVLLFTDVESYSDNLESIIVTGDFQAGHLFADSYTAEGGVTKYNIYATPEPATATLSLLALAGLMARRKRH